MGEAIGSLNIKELKNLEGRLEKAIGRVRSKKEIELQNDNMYLRAKVAQAEREAGSATHQQQPPGLMQNEYGSIPAQSYNPNFFPVNLMDTSNHHHEYPGADQTVLQLA
ncbi:hypothetical protein SAY87_030096 [Trapa incisa]|uniref:K-box domain-containing protein n=2 Tax=Trapa TaxID=22665 RepID=A0AAN7KLR9_TRANT|nr:hypothetical protein SAY87_030096 [Trapa incisa]KAK4768945.1 hypothetical protein SAY86_027095 [Trapa natans]